MDQVNISRFVLSVLKDCGKAPKYSVEIIYSYVNRKSDAPMVLLHRILRRYRILRRLYYCTMDGVLVVE